VGTSLQILDWCGYSTEYLPVPVGDGWWSLVPIWEPDQTVTRSVATNRRSRNPGAVAGQLGALPTVSYLHL